MEIFEITKWLFDLDFPNHANRRIKNIRITIPAVTGPYANLPVELTFLKSEVVEGTREGIAEGDTIATSSGQNDAGLFELNFRDERFLPFEGAGAVSTWKLSFPGTAQFDRTTITDVILHMSYTAMPGTEAIDAEPPTESGFFSVLSVRTNFPAAWESLQRSGESGEGIDITTDHLPYLARNARGASVLSVKGIPKSGSSTAIEALQPVPNGPLPGQVQLTVTQPNPYKDIFLFVQIDSEQIDSES